MTDESKTPEEIAEERAADDRELLAQLQQRDQQPRVNTLEDVYTGVAQVISRLKRDLRPALSEPTLIKLWELTLMYDLNIRNQRQAQTPYDIPTQSLGDNEPPEAHEDALVSEDQSDPETANAQ